jgi:hypothetical protein
MLFPQFTKMAIADQFFVLFVPHGPNVTRAAPVQSAGTTMMSRMFPAPVIIRRSSLLSEIESIPGQGTTVTAENLLEPTESK